MEPIVAVRQFHRETKHSTSAYAPGPGHMDWESQPSPYRRFLGAQTVRLPRGGPPLPTTFGELHSPEMTPRSFTEETLSRFAELAMGLSVWKQIGSERWALRHNPSSGNLHPTELYIVLWHPLSDQLPPGIYHYYTPYEHALECRKHFDTDTVNRLESGVSGWYAAIGLSSIHWREEWKYGARAFRYCQHDVGHALAAARYSAATLGWQLRLDTRAIDSDIRACLGLDRIDSNAEPEFPDLMAFLGEAPADESEPVDIWKIISGCSSSFHGKANSLSPRHVHWPQISAVLSSVEKKEPMTPWHSEDARMTDHDGDTAEQMDLARTAESVIRERRSAQQMTPGAAISKALFFHILRRTLPMEKQLPFDGFPFRPSIHLLLFVHRVDGLAPGLYVCMRSADTSQNFRDSCQNEDLIWQPVTDAPMPLYGLMTPLDVRRVAAAISCGQSIAANSAFSVGMIAEVDGTLRREGTWAYRRLYWEAGIIGHVLYLQAEANGLSGTGIGCFLDDSVHQLLGLPKNGNWQSLYHFTVGTALPDRRLTTLPGYHHLQGDL